MGEIIMERQKGKFVKGNHAWSKGKRLPQVSLRLKKAWQNSEFRRRQVEAHKHPNPQHSERMKILWQDPEYQIKQHSKKVGRKLSEESKAKISSSLRRLVLPKDELRNLYLDKRFSTLKIAKLYEVSQNTIIKRLKENGIELRTRSEALKGYTMGKQIKDKISTAKKGQHCSPATEFKKGFKAPKEWRDLWSKVMKDKWNDRNYVKNIMRARHARPNKPETRRMKIFKRNSLAFRYVGDGEVTIGGLCPDFILNNGDKKVIELFGRTYHDPDFTFRDRIPWHQQYWGRMAYYSQLGYKCLIIWDDELVNEEKVVERVKSWV